MTKKELIRLIPNRSTLDCSEEKKCKLLNPTRHLSCVRRESDRIFVEWGYPNGDVGVPLLLDDLSEGEQQYVYDCVERILD